MELNIFLADQNEYRILNRKYCYITTKKNEDLGRILSINQIQKYLSENELAENLL